jgi:predicted permease
MDVVKKIALHPFIIATAVGVAGAYFEVSPPVPIERFLDYLARAAAHVRCLPWA